MEKLITRQRFWGLVPLTRAQPASQSEHFRRRIKGGSNHLFVRVRASGIVAYESYFMSKKGHKREIERDIVSEKELEEGVKIRKRKFGTAVVFKKADR